jgi:holliday junction DNA helicase RuvA
MIARITGRLEEVSTDAALLDTGGIAYEILLPACEVERLARRVGQEVVLHTIHLIEGDPARGSTVPRLIGFAAEIDRDFFRLFTKVKGIGVRKALRALARPVADVATAIEDKDASALTALPEIGKRTAEQVIAELHGKLADYAGPVRAADTDEPLSDAANEALAVLVQLGERRPEAAELVQRVAAVAEPNATAEQIIQHVYRLKAGGA